MYIKKYFLTTLNVYIKFIFTYNLEYKSCYTHGAKLNEKLTPIFFNCTQTTKRFNNNILISS